MQADTDSARTRHGSHEQTRLTAIYAALDADDRCRDAAGDSATPAGTAGSPVCRTAQPGGWPLDDDLSTCRDLAEKGDPNSARRTAELYELDDNLTEAEAWWRYAADLGDEDAILYVKEVFSS